MVAAFSWNSPSTLGQTRTFRSNQDQGIAALLGDPLHPKGMDGVDSEALNSRGPLWVPKRTLSANGSRHRCSRLVTQERAVSWRLRPRFELIRFSSVALTIIAMMPPTLNAICIASPSEMSSSAMWLTKASKTPRQ
jgi:hypothetical protein